MTARMIAAALAVCLALAAVPVVNSDAWPGAGSVCMKFPCFQMVTQQP